ncbi:MAG: M23 family metallopeptidase [Candidatus Zixiibacteriota bacterium]
MAERKYITIMFIPNGAEARYGFRVRQWVLRLMVALTVVILLGMIVFFSVYGKVVARATMTERLQRENEQLRRYQLKVKLLEENLRQAQEIVSRLADLAGIDYRLPQLPDDSTFFARLDEKPGAVLARPAGLDLALPSGLPVQGFVSRDFQIDNPDHYHPGVDIACSEGTPVLATANGMVEKAAFDSIYGYMVVLRHNDSVATLYGHNRELLVDSGQLVPAGSRIALSGNTGISSAPHLHYEIRIHDKPINPLENPYDEETKLR